MAREESMQYALRQAALTGIKNRTTIKTYKRALHEFVDYIKDTTDKRKPSQLTKDDIQAYADFLKEAGYSPATIHTKLAPVCKALSVSLGDIQKPVRHSAEITRSRMPEANLQGRREATKDRFSRLVEFQKAVGIRRSELARLKVSDVYENSSGMWVHVAHGKGGKVQEQFVLPADRQAVRNTIKGLQPDDRIFSAGELNCKIDLHGLRAQHARDAYDYYAKDLQEHPEKRIEYDILLQKAFAHGNQKLREHDLRGYDRKLTRFVKEYSSERPYLVRGDNAIKARSAGRPVAYDRLALMLTSVFHLAHWRLDVTVTNYMF